MFDIASIKSEMPLLVASLPAKRTNLSDIRPCFFLKKLGSGTSFQSSQLIFKTNEEFVPSQSEQNSINNEDNTIKQIIKTGRADIQELYEAEQYVSAIHSTQMLIQLIADLREEELIKKELAQLYQDLAILYAKNNNASQANIAIDKAIDLNPTKENKEIKTLINN